MDGARFIGRSVLRREDPRLLTGHGRYVDDLQLPGTLHIAFVRSDVARGTILSVDAAAARALPGVHAVLTAAELNGDVREWWAGLAGPPSPQTPYPPTRALADTDVRYVGEPIAVVVADTRYLAEDGVDLVDVDIAPLPALVDPFAAAGEQDVLVHPELGTNTALTRATGNPEGVQAAFDTAAFVVEETFAESRASHTPMETRGIVASWDPWDERMEIWSSSQNPYEVRQFCSRLLGIPEHRIRASIGDVGGGFGQKVSVSRDEACVLLAAARIHRPLKWIEDRRENLLAAGQGRDDSMTIALALDADGRMLALRAELTENVGAFPASGVGSSSGMVGAMLPGPYRIPVMSFRSTAVYTHTAGRVAYRGPWLMETVAREQIVDRAARVLGLDPLELRRRNLVGEADQPYRTASGLCYEGVAIDRTVELAEGKADYAGLRRQQRALREQGRCIGIGVSIYVEPSGVAPPAGPMATEGVLLRIEPAGQVLVMTGAANCGNSIETTLPQIVADRLGCDLADVALVQGDTAATPVGNGMGGSRNAPIFGSASWTAATRMREKILAIAAHRLEASPDDLVMERGQVFVRGEAQPRTTLRELSGLAYHAPAQLPPGMEPGLEVMVRFASDAMYTWSTSCHICLCEVDAATGSVQLLRYVVGEDCGVVINPMVVDGQIAGGVVQGIGGALFERMVHDEDGNPLTTTFLDYLVPTAAEVPAIECHHLETPSAQPGGFRGMGEGGAIGSPPAVANAVNDALAPLGAHLERLPFGPGEVLAAIETACAAVPPTHQYAEETA